MEIPTRVFTRLMTHADRDEPTGCLISRYSVGSHGYAQIGWCAPGGKRSVVTVAHRAVWAYVHGEIPDGMTVDHTCHVRKCIELKHLRLLSNFENARRNLPGRDWELGSCINGHGAEHWRPKGPQRLKGYCVQCRKDALIAKRSA